MANNGGPTETIAPQAGSPAIDAIPVANCTDANGTAVTVDRIGTTRPQGAECDIGAVEVIASLQSQTLTFNPLLNQVFGTAAFTVSATASSGLTISFASQTTAVCTTTGTNGSTVTLLMVGPCTIQAGWQQQLRGGRSGESEFSSDAGRPDD